MNNVSRTNEAKISTAIDRRATSRSRTLRVPALIVLSAVVLGGCSIGSSAEPSTTSTSIQVTTTAAVVTTTTLPPPPTMPSGDEVFPGYPLIVDISTIDSRVASAYEGKVVDGQVVALAPGIYTPYNPNIPDLLKYLGLPNDGDCAMRETYFTNTGGSCWNGVQKGSAEP